MEVLMRGDSSLILNELGAQLVDKSDRVIKGYETSRYDHRITKDEIEVRFPDDWIMSINNFWLAPIERLYHTSYIIP